MKALKEWEWQEKTEVLWGKSLSIRTRSIKYIRESTDGMGVTGKNRSAMREISVDKN